VTNPLPEAVLRVWRATPIRTGPTGEYRVMSIPTMTRFVRGEPHRSVQ